MISLNLRQKMTGCFCLYLLFYILVGLAFLKDFEKFYDAVTLLMHSGNLSNICLEIRHYEKNYIIRHDNEDFIKVLEYIDEAQQFVPKIIDDLKTKSHSTHLEDFTAKLTAYKLSFQHVKEECRSREDVSGCPLPEEVRMLGQDLVTITEDMVLFEQQKMTDSIARFKTRLVSAVYFLALLSIMTFTLLYTAIIKPLKRVEKAAESVANGTFTLLHVDKKKGEVRSVLRAFNKMVIDLEKHQKQLFQAEKLSSIGTLASGTAHQINNPLNNIATSCQLVLADIDHEQNPFITKMLETINMETQRAGEIVRGLLEFSRSQVFSLQPYQLDELVDKVKQLVTCEVPSGIILETYIPEDITLLIDVQKMIEVLLNLTTNAIQAIPEPPGTVFIRAEKDADNKNAVITVVDTGVGIEKYNLQKIFDPFFTNKITENGTGLGLAVVYGIIEKLTGSIRVESKKNKGTSFIITLPLHQEPENVDPLGQR